MASSGHLRRGSDADTTNKYLSRREIRYGHQQRRWRPSQMASSGHLRRGSDANTTNKYLSRVKDASILSWPTSQREIRYVARVALTDVPNRASSGHLRLCSDANTTNKYLSRVKDASILSWPTYGSLEAVDFHIPSVRYDVVLE
eukprot:scaffold10246_cov97-Skeletonema_marinoi.AAC.2